MKNMGLVDWTIVIVIVGILFAVAFACSDDTTIIETSYPCDGAIGLHQQGCIHRKHRPYQSKSCQVVIDSLEAELEECRE